MIDHERKLIFIHLEGTGGTGLSYECIGVDDFSWIIKVS